MEKLLNDYKISFTKGDTYALAVKFKNITSDLGSAYFTVKENADDEPLIQKTLGAGVDKIDDRSYKQEKTYKIQLQSEDTANLEPLVQYLYDFRVAFGNVVQTILSGVFVVKHSVSNVTTTSTTTLDVELADVLESDVSTTPATQGIEYEQDPVACTKIGDLTELNTTNKETIVKAINEVNTDKNNVKNKVDDIRNGTTPVPKATDVTTSINGVPLSEIFESDGKTATKAKDVTSTINGVPLSEIFENDGKTAKQANTAEALKYNITPISLVPDDGYVDNGGFLCIPYKTIPKGLYLVGYGTLDSNGRAIEFFLNPLYLDGETGGGASAYVPDIYNTQNKYLYDLEIYVTEGRDYFQADFTQYGTESNRVKTGCLFFFRIGGEI